MKKLKVSICLFIFLLFQSSALAAVNVTTNTNNVPLCANKNDSRVILLIPNSTTLIKDSAEGEWYKVTYGENTGWIGRLYTIEGTAEIKAEKEKAEKEKAQTSTNSPVSSGTTVLGNYKNYKQSGQSWSKIPYSHGNIGNSGCGPTSVAICASGFGINLNPGQLVKKWTGRKLYASSTSNGKLLNMIGLKQTKASGSKLLQHLTSGKPALARCKKGYYTSKGHYMAVIGIRNKNGTTQVYISNPGSKSKTGWTNYSLLAERGVFEYYLVSKK